MSSRFRGLWIAIVFLGVFSTPRLWAAEGPAATQHGADEVRSLWNSVGAEWGNSTGSSRWAEPRYVGATPFGGIDKTDPVPIRQRIEVPAHWNLLGVTRGGELGVFSESQTGLSTWAVLVHAWPESLVILAILFAVLLLWRVWRSRRRWLGRRRADMIGQEFCAGCGYQLTGSTSPHCPECGIELTPANRVLFRLLTRRQVVGAAVKVVLVLALVAGGSAAHFVWPWSQLRPGSDVGHTWFIWSCIVPRTWPWWYYRLPKWAQRPYDLGTVHLNRVFLVDLSNGQPTYHFAYSTGDAAQVSPSGKMLVRLTPSGMKSYRLPDFAHTSLKSFRPTVCRSGPTVARDRPLLSEDDQVFWIDWSERRVCRWDPATGDIEWLARTRDFCVGAATTQPAAEMARLLILQYADRKRIVIEELGWQRPSKILLGDPNGRKITSLAVFVMRAVAPGGRRVLGWQYDVPLPENADRNQEATATTHWSQWDFETLDAALESRIPAHSEVTAIETFFREDLVIHLCTKVDPSHGGPYAPQTKPTIESFISLWDARRTCWLKAYRDVDQLVVPHVYGDAPHAFITGDKKRIVTSVVLNDESHGRTIRPKAQWITILDVSALIGDSKSPATEPSAQ